MSEFQSKKTEMERTFLPDSLPNNLNNYRPRAITDIYLSPADAISKIRLRNIDRQEFQLTKKIIVNPDDVSVQDEYHIDLTKDEFDMFLLLPGRKVIKDRYETEIEGSLAEIDVFRGPLSGLVMIEFEFLDHEAQLSFVPPQICKTEVTQETFITGAYLAGKSYADIASDLARFSYKQLGKP